MEGALPASCRCRQQRGTAVSAKTPTRWPTPTRRSATTAGNRKEGPSWHANIRWSVTVTSASWPTSTPARPRRPSASCSTPAVNHKIGEVHDGAATMDWMEQEQERGITITSAATTTFWNEDPADGIQNRFNIIDTLATSTSPSRSSVRWRVLDGASPCSTARRRRAAVRNRVASGRQVRRVPRIVFVNKMDKIGADFYNCVQDDQGPHRRHPRPIAAADRRRGTTSGRGIVDLIEMEEWVWRGETTSAQATVRQPIPPTQEADEWRGKMIEGGRRNRRRRSWKPTSRQRARRREARADPQGHARRCPSSRSCAARRSRTRACSRCSTRSSTTCLAAGPADQGRPATTDRNPNIERTADRRAVLGAGVQDHERPFVGSLTFTRIYSGRPGRIAGRPGAELDHGASERASAR